MSNNITQADIMVSGGTYPTILLSNLNTLQRESVGGNYRYLIRLAVAMSRERLDHDSNGDNADVW